MTQTEPTPKYVVLWQTDQLRDGRTIVEAPHGLKAETTVLHYLDGKGILGARCTSTSLYYGDEEPEVVAS